MVSSHVLPMSSSQQLPQVFPTFPFCVSIHPQSTYTLAASHGETITVRASYLQIYNENVSDLLRHDKRLLQVLHPAVPHSSLQSPHIHSLSIVSLCLFSPTCFRNPLHFNLTISW